LLQSSDNLNAEKKESDNDIDGGSWTMTGSKMAMCIYSGSMNTGFGQSNDRNNNRLPWINVHIHAKMTFLDLVDAACAQLGLPPPSKQQNNANTTNATNIWPTLTMNNQCSDKQQYIVRNQMGHKCPMDQIVIKYLDQMVMNTNLFPVFIFTKTSQTAQQQQQRQRPPQQQNTSFLNFAPSGSGTQTNPFQWR